MPVAHQDWQPQHAEQLLDPHLQPWQAAAPANLVLTTARTACSIVIVPGGATVAASLHTLQSLSIKQ